MNKSPHERRATSRWEVETWFFKNKQRTTTTKKPTPPSRVQMWHTPTTLLGWSEVSDHSVCWGRKARAVAIAALTPWLHEQEQKGIELSSSLAKVCEHRCFQHYTHPLMGDGEYKQSRHSAPSLTLTCVHTQSTLQLGSWSHGHAE